MVYTKSQLSIDKTDVKSVSWWKRLQHRNIINYPPVFHQMTSLISAVSDRGAFVVTVYVLLRTCLSMYIFKFTCKSFVCVCVCRHMLLCLHLYMCCLHVFNAIQPTSISFLSGLILSSDINLSFLQVI